MYHELWMNYVETEWQIHLLSEGQYETILTSDKV